jgi:RNA polymerase sigma factor (sigma-70 family)
MVIVEVDVKKLSNIELVRHCAVKPDDGPVWDEFVNRFTPCITLYIARALKANSSRHWTISRTESRETIHDLVQDVYLRLLNHDHQALRFFQGRHENSIYLYLARIATAVVIDYLRERLSAPGPTRMISWHELLAQDGAATDNPQAPPQPSYTDQRIEEWIAIHDIKYRLEHLLANGDRQRNIRLFLLHAFDGLTARELAAQTSWGLTTKGVETILFRLKNRLRESLAAELRSRTS